jgi:hypothetical protein
VKAEGLPRRLALKEGVEMRALGPGSVSSFLKVILDVFRIVLWVAVGGVTVAIVAVLLLSFQPELLAAYIPAHLPGGPWLGPVAAAALLAIDLYLGGAIVVVGRLRAIFQTLIAGDPFRPENVRRLRVIGGALAVLELGRHLVAFLTRLMFAHLHFNGAPPHAGLGLTTWFAVLVIVVLAEVFREGARLRRDAELTI